MSILYGGKGLYKLAAWKQKPDEHWFGGNIPGNLHLSTRLAGWLPANFQYYPESYSFKSLITNPPPGARCRLILLTDVISFFSII